ncbi:MAG TPA: MFS transporter [Steroidobacteraceae bacterium]|nr:MFS transporter [Steroidobacteraceae bacterium]
MSGPAAGSHALPARQRVRVRWKIFLYLFGFGFIVYMQQRAIPVASVEMMPRLALSQVQIAWLEQALLIGYTVMQFPGGVLGQRLGARRSFVIISLIALAAYVATPLAPLLTAGAALFAMLAVLQLLLGAAQGPVFPVSAGVFQTWFTPDKWPLVQGLQSMGLQLGAAVMPPLITWLMDAFDWQRALLWSALPALLLIGAWAWYGRNTPAEHPAVSAAELAELAAHPATPVDSAISWARMWALMKNRDVLLLTASYVCMNYVFYLLANWCFLYLVQERHFARLESGWLASTPPLAAAVAAGLGGKLASSLAVRYGVRRGLAIVPLISLPAAAILQFLAVDAANAYLAVLALALCFGAVELNEGPYWAAIMHVGRADAMAASGLLNTGGNAGGLIATPIVGYLSSRHEWTLAFWIGAAFAIAGAAAWLAVDPSRGESK